jgi:hypothetical protein
MRIDDMTKSKISAFTKLLEGSAEDAVGFAL